MTGGICSLESIPGLLESLKIPSLESEKEVGTKKIEEVYMIGRLCTSNLKGWAII